MSRPESQPLNLPPESADLLADACSEIDQLARMTTAAPVQFTPGSTAHSATGLHRMLVKMTEQRRMVCLEATWEIDAIARALPGLVQYDTVDDGHPHLLVRAMAGRLLRLSSVLMAALDDDAEETRELERVVRLDGGQG